MNTGWHGKTLGRKFDQAQQYQQTTCSKCNESCIQWPCTSESDRTYNLANPRHNCINYILQHESTNSNNTDIQIGSKCNESCIQRPCTSESNRTYRKFNQAQQYQQTKCLKCNESCIKWPCTSESDRTYNLANPRHNCMNYILPHESTNRNNTDKQKMFEMQRIMHTATVYIRVESHV